ncbi:MAG: UDP-2,3-diacylglucosamine diphosphatase [Alphaproteobacteria bacterium]|nr:MAG: UDP-2,3-diacylglucosamine diphosphatase [Alphaproteobacteria bacterium]
MTQPPPLPPLDPSSTISPVVLPQDVRVYRTIWISDIHLGTRGCQAEMLLDFLAHTRSEYLYLVGDIVDGWRLKRRWYWPATHNEVMHAILRRVQDGTRVFYLPGNHDEAARDYLNLRFGGVLVIDSLTHETMDGKRLLVIHGDQFDAVMGYSKWLGHLGDILYTLILSINGVFNKARRRMGFSYWSLSAYLKRKVKNAVQLITAYKKFLVLEARRSGADGIVCGHIHFAEMKQMGAPGGPDILYCNDGDWVESCTALVEHADGRLEILRWGDEMAKREGLVAKPPRRRRWRKAPPPEQNGA